MRSLFVCLVLSGLVSAPLAKAADPYVSLGLLELPESVKIGPMSAVAVDASDNVFVLHRGEPAILMFDAKHKFVRGFGEGLFKLPHGLRIDSAGHIWTTDNANHVLRQFKADGTLVRTIPADGKAGGGKTGFRAPDDLVFDTDGNMYIADAGNGRIVKLDKGGEYVAEWGSKGKKPGQFATAHSLAIDGENRIYVGDRGNKRVQVFDNSGKHLADWSGFGNPFGLLVVGKELLASEGDLHKIFVLDADGKVTGSWGDPKSMLLPHLMAIDSKGVLYVAEVNGKRVQMYKRQ